MVPMVRTAGEVVAVRRVVDAAGGGVPVGAMVETVAACEGIAELARVADFFSIGTNDLTAEVLDLDRRDPRARPALAADPRVLRMVGDVVAGAGGRPVSVCGDAGAHPLTLPLLVGAGVRAVSVACARVDDTRYLLRRLSTVDCEALFAAAVRLRDADEVLALVRERMEVQLP
jgi:phosphoenolpyruvate-protein kinase (PTS system EI component)